MIIALVTWQRPKICWTITSVKPRRGRTSMNQKRCIPPNNTGEMDTMWIKTIPVGGTEKGHIRPIYPLREKDASSDSVLKTQIKIIYTGRARKERYMWWWVMGETGQTTTISTQMYPKFCSYTSHSFRDHHGSHWIRCVSLLKIIERKKSSATSRSSITYGMPMDAT